MKKSIFLLFIFVQGCSFVRSSGPIWTKNQSGEKVLLRDCSGDGKIFADGMSAALFFIASGVTAGGLAATDSYYSHAAASVAATVIPAVIGSVFTGSAIYGASMRDQCFEAEAQEASEAVDIEVFVKSPNKKFRIINNVYGYTVDDLRRYSKRIGGNAVIISGRDSSVSGAYMSGGPYGAHVSVFNEEYIYGLAISVSDGDPHLSKKRPGTYSEPEAQSNPVAPGIELDGQMEKSHAR